MELAAVASGDPTLMLADGYDAVREYVLTGEPVVALENVQYPTAEAAALRHDVVIQNRNGTLLATVSLFGCYRRRIVLGPALSHLGSTWQHQFNVPVDAP